MIFFFFNDTATTEIYTLSLHDALPIFVEPGGAVGVTPHGRIDLGERLGGGEGGPARRPVYADGHDAPDPGGVGGRDHLGLRSEEHTSELQSQSNLVCRLLLEKKKPLDYRPSDSLSPLHSHLSLLVGARLVSLIVPFEKVPLLDMLEQSVHSLCSASPVAVVDF